MKKQVAIVHYNTPEITQAAIWSLRKHGGDYEVFVFDNSDTRPFTAKMKGVTYVERIIFCYNACDFHILILVCFFRGLSGRPPNPFGHAP